MRVSKPQQSYLTTVQRAHTIPAPALCSVVASTPTTAPHKAGFTMPDNRPWYIYALTDPRDDAVRYVGWTLRPKKRLIEHVYQARHKTNNRYIGNWLRQLLALGLRPGMRILETGMGDWQEAEQRWIAHYRAAGARLTNLSDGGEGTPGVPMSEAAKKKLSDARRGVPYPPGRIPGMLGKTHTPEVKAQIAARNREFRHTDETRRKLSELKKGQRPSDKTLAAASAYRKGRPTSEDVRLKIAAATKNRKPVRSKTTGEVYPSITACARAFGVSEATINQSIRKGRRGAGHYWEFVDDNA